jgi:WD40 repeat protein/predicted Ser/Thr protein kinase
VLVERVGGGGFGTVYRAVEKATSKVVAVKVLIGEHRSDPESLKRFKKEAEIGAKLDHPNIVPCGPMRWCQGAPYVVMDYVDGPSLLRALGKKPIPGRRAVAILRPVVDAVAHAHSRGVLHRDLKPANILIDRASGKPLVIDFGLARDLDANTQVTQTLAVLGTQAYMPPEQADPTLGEYSPATDIYALGVTLYQMLTGVTPFPRHDQPARDMLAQIAWSRPLPPSAIHGQVHADLDRICAVCLQKSPFDRYPSAQELAADLLRFERGEPVKARSPSRAKRFLRTCQRRPAEAFGVLVLFILAVGGGAAAWVFSRQAERSIDELQAVAPRIEAAEARTAEAEVDRQRAEEQRAEVAAQAHSAAQTRDARAYLADMQDAWRAWTGGDIQRMRRLLDRQVPTEGAVDPRGFEWHYLSRTLDSACLRLTGGATGDRGVAVSSDGRWIAAIDDDQATLWSESAGRPVFSQRVGPGNARGHLFEPRSVGNHILHSQRVALHPTGALVAATFPSDGGGNVRVWDASGRERFAITADRRLSGHAIVFSPYGDEMMVAGLGRDWAAWSTVDWSEVQPQRAIVYGGLSDNADLHPTLGLWFAGGDELHSYDGQLSVFALQPSSRAYSRISIANEIRPIIGMTPSLEMVLRPEQRMFGIHQPSFDKRPFVPGLGTSSFARDADFVAAGCLDGIVRVWKVPELEREVPSLDRELRGCGGPPTAVAIAGTRVAAASSGAICVWPGTGRPPLFDWSPATSGPRSSTSSPLTASWDEQSHRLRFTDGNGGLVGASEPNPYHMASYAVSPSGRHAVVFTSNRGKGADLAAIDHSRVSVVQLFNGESMAEVARMSVPDGESPMALLFSPDGSLVLIGSLRGAAVLVRTSDGQVAQQLAGFLAYAACFSSCGRFLACGNQDRVGVWDIPNQRWIVTEEQGASAVRFDSFGAKVYVQPSGPRQAARLIDVATATVRPIAGNPGALGHLWMSRDGSRWYAWNERELEVYLTILEGEEPALKIRWPREGLDLLTLGPALDDLAAEWRREEIPSPP